MQMICCEYSKIYKLPCTSCCFCDCCLWTSKVAESLWKLYSPILYQPPPIQRYATQAKRHPARDTGETSNNGTETLAHVAHGAFGFQPSLGKQHRVESSTEANKDWLVTKFYSPHIFLETYLYPKNNEFLL